MVFLSADRFFIFNNVESSLTSVLLHGLLAFYINTGFINHSVNKTKGLTANVGE